MPLNELTSFLRLKAKVTKKQIVCQCPHTGSYHFYQNYCSKEIHRTMCQCPYTGLHHFYKSKDGEKVKSVNALKRVYSISTSRLVKFRDIEQMCQCPHTGLHHFYGKVTGTFDWRTESVNALKRAYIISTNSEFSLLDNTDVSMPSSGLISFLHCRVYVKGKEKYSVNALNRAYVISTYRV